MLRLVVKSHRPWQFAVGIIALSMLIAVVTWGILDKSHWSYLRQLIVTGNEHKELWQANQTLEQENKELHAKVLMLEQTTMLDKRTASLLQDELTVLQDEIHQLKGELEFYQGVMDAARDSQGLNVYGVYVTPLSIERGYRLKLVLTHVVKGGKVAEGRLQVTIEGSENGNLRKINLEDLSIDDSLELGVRFKSFNRFETNLMLPEGFVPHRVLVQLKPKYRNQATIKKIFDWPTTAS